MNDPHHLSRFAAAQNHGDRYRHVVAELEAGRKATHWMWYVFPQMAGLGRTATSREYAIHSLAEARAYLRHPVLGLRLRECAHLLLAIEGRTAQDILGGIDAMKLRSSMTLFNQAAPDEPVFVQVLAKYFDAAPDEQTLRLLANSERDRRDRP